MEGADVQGVLLPGSAAVWGAEGDGEPVSLGAVHPAGETVAEPVIRPTPTIDRPLAKIDCERADRDFPR